MLTPGTAARRRPDSEVLKQALEPLVKSPEYEGVPTLARERNAYNSHYESEVATLSWPNGKVLRVLVKYDDGDNLMAEGRITVGPLYEARIYRDVLSRFAVSRPRYFGTWLDPASGSSMLLIEYLDGRHAHKTGDYVQGFSAAAAWIGRWHALASPLVATGTLPAMNVYDAGLYEYWATRARRFERRTTAGRTWLPKLFRRIDTVIGLLGDASQTVIHGDYYPDNMVYLDGVVWPFDWEQAAIAPGEIDLASLTEGWHEDVLQAAERSYCSARWPGGAPERFHATVDAARIFVLLRLLGEAPAWPNRAMRRKRVERLRQSAERLGLI